jgi:hypothetical protein
VSSRDIVFARPMPRRAVHEAGCFKRSRSFLSTTPARPVSRRDSPRLETRIEYSRPPWWTRLSSSRNQRAGLSENRYLSRETPRRALRTRDAWSLRCALSRAFAGSGCLGALTTRPKRRPLIREKEEERPPFRALTTRPTTWKKLSACALA